MEEFLTNRPTLLRLLPKIGLDADLGIDFLCVAGVIVSFVAAISKDHRNALVAALQWIFYLSIAQVSTFSICGKTFPTSQCNNINSKLRLVFILIIL